MNGRGRSLAELVAAGAELAVLTDGPCAGAWYLRAELEAQQAAARHVHARGGTRVLGDKAHYRPTDTGLEHPKPEEQALGVRGRGWTYQTPELQPSGPARAAATPTRHVPCTGCGQRLLLVRPGRTHCERCRLDGVTAAAAPRRVLVTGSRTWTNTEAIRAALAAVWGDGTAVLVSGACPRGADRLAEQLWTRWGGHVERHPADWDRHGRGAGYRRNTAMVERGADLCLAFIHAGSPGASHTTALAEAAGIPTHHHTEPPRKR